MPIAASRGEPKATGKIKEPVIFPIESGNSCPAPSYRFSPLLSGSTQISSTPFCCWLGRFRRLRAKTSWVGVSHRLPPAPKARVQGRVLLLAPPGLRSWLIHSSRSPPCSPDSVSWHQGQSFIVFKSLKRPPKGFFLHFFTSHGTSSLTLEPRLCLPHPQRTANPSKKLVPFPTTSSCRPVAVSKVQNHSSLFPSGIGQHHPARGSRFPAGTQKSPLTLPLMPWRGERPLLPGTVWQRWRRAG